MTNVHCKSPVPKQFNKKIRKIAARNLYNDNLTIHQGRTRICLHTFWFHHGRDAVDFKGQSKRWTFEDQFIQSRSKMISHFLRYTHYVLGDVHK